jgi:hypothetical protein
MQVLMQVLMLAQAQESHKSPQASAPMLAHPQ